MKKYEVSKIRNVAIIAHGGAGKTSLTEAMLFDAGVTTRLGRVSEGNTVTDFDEDEIKRQISINSALAFCEWKGTKINIIDTPGFAVFLPDARAALRVADAAVVIVSAISGVKVQTEKVWHYAQEFNLPRAVFINKMDRENSDFYRALREVEERLECKPLCMELPIGQAADFKGVVDLLAMKAFYYKDDGSGKSEQKDTPADQKAKAEEYRRKIVEAAAEADDALLEKYLDKGELTEEEMLKGLNKGFHEGAIVPVFCGAATKNMAVQNLMDFIVTAFPSPAQRPPFAGLDPKTQKEVKRKADEKEPLSVYVFKTIADPYAGKITLFRVCSGVFNSDSTLLNATKETKERVGQLACLQGKAQHLTSNIGAGDLGAVAKLKETTTGNTLCDEKAAVIYEATKYPEPIMSFAIEPKSKGDEEKLSSALARTAEEDPTIKLSRDLQTKEIILSGMGDVHLEITVERIKRKFGVEVTMKTPRVPYKETIKVAAEAQGKYKKQTGGRGQYGDCWIKIEPRERSKGFEFDNKIVGGVIPRQYIPAVEKGIVEAMEKGILAGYPVVDIKVTLFDGSYHTVDSSEMAFKIAGSLAIKKCSQNAQMCLLEPIMNVDVTIPDDCMGDIIGDLNSKRGRVLGVEPSGKFQTVKAQAPLSEMLKYASELKSMTGDRGMYSMEFSHYEELPAHLADKVIAATKKEKEEEEE
jgi:elongation factor G